MLKIKDGEIVNEFKNLRPDWSVFGFYVHRDEDDFIEISVEVCYKEERYISRYDVEDGTKGSMLGPSITLNYFSTGKKELSEIVGMNFEVKTPEESEEREDTIYIFEHELFDSYKLTIVELDEKNVHVKLVGKAPDYKPLEIELDCWLPIK